MNLGNSNQEMGNTSLYPTGFFLVPIADVEMPSSNIGEAGGTVMTAEHQTDEASSWDWPVPSGSVVIDQVHVGARGQCERYSDEQPPYLLQGNPVYCLESSK
jgi:hypothetical protein